jgi:hypothetical protein
MLKKEQRDFSTKDLWLASALVHLLNTLPNYRVENGQTIFVFPKSDSLYQSIEAYNSGIPINAYEYAQTIKRLKSEMYSRREGQR